MLRNARLCLFVLAALACWSATSSPSLASEFVVIRKRFPSAVHLGKEGESRESLGFFSVFKAYHQIVSVPEDYDYREVPISFRQ